MLPTFILIMNTYIKLSFEQVPTNEKEILIAELSDRGFYGFEEPPTGLTAFCLENEFDENLVRDYLDKNDYKYSKEILEEKNWNQIWEENFKPVCIDEFCTVRASFHTAIPGSRFDIIITPKMSFGTGHHATTHMMIQQMASLEVEHKSILDFGTGTGVLAILGEKLGAAEIVAIDNDDWSISNATENIDLNKSNKILLQSASVLNLNRQFDIILANINKNVLMTSMAGFQQHLKKAGVLVLSGLLETDRGGIEDEAKKYGLTTEKCVSREGWISLKMVIA